MGVQTSPLHTLQFVVHRNYALLLLQLSFGVKGAQKTEALAHFRRALSVDPTDTGLWYQFGTLAWSLNQYNTAIWGFLRGMEMQAVTGLGKHQAFQCLEGLIQVIYSHGARSERSFKADSL